MADPAGRWPGLAPRGPGRLCHCLDRSGGCRRPIAGRVGAPGRVFRFPSLQCVGSKGLKLRKFFIKNGFPVFLKNGESWRCRGHLGRAGWSREAASASCQERAPHFATVPIAPWRAGLRSGHHLTPTAPVRAPPPPTLLLTRWATGRRCRAPAACSQLRVPGGTTPSKDTALRLPLPAWPAWVAALEPDSFTSP